MVAGVLGWAAAAGAAPKLDVVAVQPAGDDVTLIAGVQPVPATPLRSGAFRITDVTGATLAGTAEPVVSAELATGLVLDTSDAGAAALQGGVNGAANFLLQLPDGARTLVVTDGGPPTVLAPLTAGAAPAIAAVNSARPGGERQTGTALAVAMDGLPAVPEQPRLLLLYTGAADAGGEPAADLARRLRTAGVLLAVVATGPDQRYWSQVAEDTGGVLVSGRGLPTLRPFDRLAGLLRGRYAMSFPRPAVLPATVRLSVTVGDETATAPATVPAEVAAVPPPEPGGPATGSGARWWVLLLVLLVVAAAAGLALLVRRRAAAPVRELPAPAPDATPVRPVTHLRPVPPLPTRPGVLAPVEPPPPALRTTPQPAPAAQVAPLTRRVPGRSRPIPEPAGTGPADAAPTGATPADVTPAETTLADTTPAVTMPADTTPAGATSTDATPTDTTPPTRRPDADTPQPARDPDPAPDEPTAPAAETVTTPPAAPEKATPPADEQAYRRLDAEAGRAAADVAHGRLDSAHAVARIAFAARGRLDLLDRVIETERLLTGADLGASPPPAAVLTLLAAARRIVAGEIALVGPAGVRVEQRVRIGPDGRPRHVLRLTGRDRSVRECRTTGELARHVDLASLTPDSPA